MQGPVTPKRRTERDWRGFLQLTLLGCLPVRFWRRCKFVFGLRTTPPEHRSLTQVLQTPQHLLTTGNPPLCSTTATSQSSWAENCGGVGENNEKKLIEVSNYELSNIRKYLNNESVEEACEEGTYSLFLLEATTNQHYSILDCGLCLSKD